MEKNLQLKAAILAGGLGTRLRPLVSDRPKVIADVGGRPFLFYLLDQIVQWGISDVILCVGYRADQIRDLLGSKYGPLRIHYSREESALGTGGALRLALPMLDSDPVLVMNGDSYLELDLEMLVSWHYRCRGEVTICMSYENETGRFGMIEMDEGGRLTGFFEKKGDCEPGWINTGIYIISRRLISEIPEGEVVSLERDLLPSWLKYGVYGYKCESKLIDIGTPEAYRAAGAIFRDGKR